MGKPLVTIDFPKRVSPGSRHTAIIEIDNPGQGDMDSIAVTFSLVGRSSSEGGVPSPIVPLGFDHKNEAVVSSDPEATAVSEDGIVYFFDGIREGETKTIRFELEVPRDLGAAANAVIVSDGQDVERARGATLETTVG